MVCVTEQAAMDGGSAPAAPAAPAAPPATPRRRLRWSPASDASVYGDPASVAQADMIVAAMAIVIGLASYIIILARSGRVAALLFAAASAAAAAATRLPSYDRHRTAVTVAHRLIVAVAGQVLVGGVARNPTVLPPPTTVRAWIGWCLTRTSPQVAAMLAASGRQPTIERAVALGIVSTIGYAALQPFACRGILTSYRGIDAYYVYATQAVSATAARVAALVGAPSTLPARAAAAPCALPACVAVMTMLHAVACVAPALIVHPLSRWAVDVWVATVVCFQSLWLAIDLTYIARQPCAPLAVHPMAGLQGDSRVGLLETAAAAWSRWRGW